MGTKIAKEAFFHVLDLDHAAARPHRDGPSLACSSLSEIVCRPLSPRSDRGLPGRCTFLASITLRPAVIAIGRHAFSGCTSRARAHTQRHPCHTPTANPQEGLARLRQCTYSFHVMLTCNVMCNGCAVEITVISSAQAWKT